MVIEIPCTDRDRKENWWDSLWKTTMNVINLIILKIWNPNINNGHNWQLKGKYAKRKLWISVLVITHSLIVLHKVMTVFLLSLWLRIIISCCCRAPPATNTRRSEENLEFIYWISPPRDRDTHMADALVSSCPGCHS